MPTDFSTLTSRSHLERIEDAIVEALTHDTETGSFCPWHRVTDPETWLDIPPPYGRVVVVFSEDKFQLSMESEVTVTAEVGLAYEESRAILRPGEKGAHSFENAVLRVLREERNSHLGAGNGNLSVVDRLVSFLGTSYGQIRFPTVVDGEEQVYGLQVLGIGVEYAYTINAKRDPS